MRVFDCFMYFNEDVVLELRLNYLNKFDKYTIVMASVNKNIYLLQHFPRVLLELLLVSVLIFAVFILITILQILYLSYEFYKRHCNENFN